MKFNRNESHTKHQYTDAEYENRLGIRDWSDRYNSYSECLYRHSRLPYDNRGIFLIDKLSILFTCGYDHPFFLTPYLFRLEDFKNRFQLDDELTLVEIRNHNQTYNYSYSIEVNGLHLGVMNLSHTSRNDQVKITIDNEYLYTQSPLDIIQNLMVICSKMNLKFMNYGDYDIAYDSIIDHLGKVLQTYYKSDRCSDHIYQAYNEKPIYKLKGSKRIINTVIDDHDTRKGTYSEGSKSSSTQAKIYDKSYELVSNNKPYISSIHHKFFGDKYPSIYRVEVSAKPSAFYDGGVMGSKDLIDLLMPDQLGANFKTILGNKLVYKSIKPTGYTKTRNERYEEIHIVDLGDIRINKCEVKPVNQYKKHDQHVDRFRYLVNLFLDNEVSFLTLVVYTIRHVEETKDTKKRLLLGLEHCISSYKNPMCKRVKKRLYLLKEYLQKNNSSLKDIWLKAKLILS